MKVTMSKEVMSDVLQYARGAYPREFFAFLGGKMSKSEIVVNSMHYHPTLSTQKNVTILPSLETNLSGIVGTVHSHPGGDLTPSKRDLITFSNYPVNLIANQDTFRVYDRNGREIHHSLKNLKAKVNEVDRLHALVYFEALRERKEWEILKTNTALMAVAAVMMIVLMLGFIIN